jgi:fumarate reductase flavoprotein subunit
METADRHARQQALMPFKHMLPEHLRGYNQRLGDEQ